MNKGGREMLYLVTVLNWGEMSPSGNISDFGGDMKPSAAIKRTIFAIQ